MRFRKSKKVGPFRLNFSNAGIGVSVGVKGARVGMNACGSYIHVGRGGVYYRKTFPHGKEPKSARHDEPAGRSLPAVGNREEALQAQLETSVPDDLKRQLSRAKSPAWEAYLLSAVLYFALLQVDGALALVATVIVFVGLRAWSKHRRRVTLTYDLDEIGRNTVGSLQQILEHLSATSRFWFINHEQVETDWKRNAGANRSIGRSLATVTRDKMPNVTTNVPVWGIGGKKGPRCYFLPDALYILQNGTYGVFPYDELSVLGSYTRFIESERVPGDAQVIDKTWQYVNKSGGPDRRFNFNRQLPVAKYGVLYLESDSGLNLEYQISNVEITNDVAIAFEELFAIQREFALENDAPIASDTAEDRPVPAEENGPQPAEKVSRGASLGRRVFYGGLIALSLIIVGGLVSNAFRDEVAVQGAAAESSLPTVDVTFESDPPDAAIVIGDRVLGRTPVTLPVTQGRDVTYTVEAREPYEYNLYKPFTGTLNVTEDDAISVWLERTTAEEQRAQIEELRRSETGDE